MSRFSLLLAPALLTAACATQPPPAPAPAPAAPPAAVPSAADADAVAKRVSALADEYMLALLEQAPEYGTFLGLPIANHAAISDNSLAAMRAWEQREDGWLEQARAIDAAALRGRPEWITYGFLREQLESSRQSRVCRSELWGVSQMFGWHTMYPQLARLQPVGTPELRAAALERFAKFPAFVDAEIEKLREGVRQGYTAPRGNVERVIEQVEGLMGAPVAESQFASPAQRDSTPEFRRELETLVSTGINPALKRYRDYLKNEYLPAARTEVGLSALPNGRECYRALVRSYTTLDLEPRAIHRTGLEQMDKIQAEMKTIAERSFATSDVPALLQRFKTDRQYTFETRQEIVDYAQAAVDRGRAEMPKWFGRLPKADVRIEPYPEFEEKSAPGASYMPPAEDGSRPGLYRINTYQPERQSKVGMESTAFHEAMPGHHLQIALAQERPAAHPITRYLGNSGFSEGWGLYSERLADEMGLFSSDLDRMGLLSNEAFRAARLVVDPGLHVLGWSRQQAIDYMLEHTAESEIAAANEIDRYIIMPGQATAYMTGSLHIQRLRAMAEQRLGEKFDIREFHDRVLEDGAVTLPMLENKIETWVAETR